MSRRIITEIFLRPEFMHVRCKACIGCAVDAQKSGGRLEGVITSPLDLAAKSVTLSGAISRRLIPPELALVLGMTSLGKFPPRASQTNVCKALTRSRPPSLFALEGVHSTGRR
jgi:hypothetical protein